MKLMQVFGDLDALKTDKTIADVLQTRDNNLINLFKNTFANSLPLGEQTPLKSFRKGRQRSSYRYKKNKDRAN